MVVHTSNPSTWEERQEDGESEVSLGYIGRSSLRKTKG
jgi:hypothetical protein